MITGALHGLAERAAPQSPEARRSLQPLRAIRARFGEIRREDAAAGGDALGAQLERLREADPAAFARIAGRLAMPSAPGLPGTGASLPVA